MADKRAPRYRVSENKSRYDLKIEVLTHYGRKGELVCCWGDCTESDVDVLTLDHVDNSGKVERKSGITKTGSRMYKHLKNLGYPSGFQTLCWNHQWKKEIVRRRDEVDLRHSMLEPPRSYHKKV
jgi:hypothetical protein